MIKNLTLALALMSSTAFAAPPGTPPASNFGGLLSQEASGDVGSTKPYAGVGTEDGMGTSDPYNTKRNRRVMESQGLAKEGLRKMRADLAALNTRIDLFDQNPPFPAGDPQNEDSLNKLYKDRWELERSIKATEQRLGFAPGGEAPIVPPRNEPPVTKMSPSGDPSQDELNAILAKRKLISEQGY